MFQHCFEAQKNHGLSTQKQGLPREHAASSLNMRADSRYVAMTDSKASKFDKDELAHSNSSP
jgi:hypothetical protein